METDSPASPSPSLIIHSDGACSGNPGPGGWAVRIRYPEGRVRTTGGVLVLNGKDQFVELQKELNSAAREFLKKRSDAMFEELAKEEKQH